MQASFFHRLSICDPSILFDCSVLRFHVRILGMRSVVLTPFNFTRYSISNVRIKKDHDLP